MLGKDGWRRQNTQVHTPLSYHEHVAGDGVGQVRDGGVSVRAAVALVRGLAFRAAVGFVTDGSAGHEPDSGNDFIPKSMSRNDDRTLSPQMASKD